MKLAAVYCLTIIVVLGVSAFALLKFMAMLSVNPITNVLLGGLFVVLRAQPVRHVRHSRCRTSLLAVRRRSRRRAGWSARSSGRWRSRIVSFTCVAPFLGGFAGISAADAAAVSSTCRPLGSSAGWRSPTAFAAPFFVLALFPSLLKSLPKSGGWLDSVKVVMGFLEMAAALKFFRTAELGSSRRPSTSPTTSCSAGWVAISFAVRAVPAQCVPLAARRGEAEHRRAAAPLRARLPGPGVYLLPAVFKIRRGSGSARPGRSMPGSMRSSCRSRTANLICTGALTFTIPSRGPAGREGRRREANPRGFHWRDLHELPLQREYGLPTTQPSAN